VVKERLARKAYSSAVPVVPKIKVRMEAQILSSPPPHLSLHELLRKCSTFTFHNTCKKMVNQYINRKMFDNVRSMSKKYLQTGSE